MSAVDDRLPDKMPDVGTLPPLYNAVVVPKLLAKAAGKTKDANQALCFNHREAPKVMIAKAVRNNDWGGSYFESDNGERPVSAAGAVAYLAAQ